MPRHGEVHRRGDLGLVRHVAPGVGRRGAELGGHGAAGVVLHVREDHLGAVPDELGGRRLADAAGRAGDDGDLAGKPLRV